MKKRGSADGLDRLPASIANLNEGKGAPVTARFGEDGITIIDPHRASEGKVFQRIYGKAS